MKLLEANLPDKQSDIILIALQDMEWVEKHKNYRVDMRTYHSPNGQCKVCFAGGIMARSKGTSCKKGCSPADFSVRDENIFEALDSLRNYHIDYFMQTARETPRRLTEEEKNALTEINKHLEIKIITHKSSFGYGDYFTYDYSHLPKYEDSKAGFKRNMETIAAILQEHGL